MNKKLNFLLLIFIGLFFSCNFPNEITIPESSKTVDAFSREFINKIISGQLESSYSDIDPTILNQQAKEFIINANKNLSGDKLKTYRVVEYKWRIFSSTNSEKSTEYNLSYEYEFENKNVLFTTAIKEKNNKLSIVMFDGQILSGKLSELTEFTFENKNFKHYTFLVLAILIPIFIIITFIFMLRSRITTKKKVLWGFIILLACFPKFVIDWNNGQLDYNLLNFTLLGSSFYKANLYSSWLISFHIPIGALVYWYRRNSYLITETKEQKEE